MSDRVAEHRGPGVQGLSGQLGRRGGVRAVQVDEPHPQAEGDRRPGHGHQMFDERPDRFGPGLEQPPNQVGCVAPRLQGLDFPDAAVDLHYGLGRVGEPLPELRGDGAGQRPASLLVFSDGVRAGVLLGQSKKEDAPSYTSGLLIGADVRIGLSWPVGAQITIMGRPELTRLYAAAVVEHGREAIELDGEECFLAGIHEIAKRIGK